MRVGIIGAGAIGGMIAHRIAALGNHAVAVLARGAHLDAIRRNGLTMLERERRSTVSVTASDDPAALGPQDMLILGLKAYSLAALGPALAPMIGPGTILVPVQNGIPWWYFHREGGPLDGSRLDAIDADGAIARALDPARVVGAVTYGGASVPEPGVIRVSLDETVLFGEPDGTLSPRLDTVVGLFKAAGFDAQATQTIRTSIWQKLWGNATVNPISVLANCTVDRMLADPAVKATLRAAMIEVRAVAERLGITFTLSLDERFVQISRLGAFKTSMLQDLEADRPLEVEALVGAVVELGRKLDVAMPVMETIYALTRLRGIKP